jgi:hypothetical protein
VPHSRSLDVVDIDEDDIHRFGSSPAFGGGDRQFGVRNLA